MLIRRATITTSRTVGAYLAGDAVRRPIVSGIKVVVRPANTPTVCTKADFFAPRFGVRGQAYIDMATRRSQSGRSTGA